jgi:4-amino-4-deoxy-L-arabinose transferase-like glycosyltransferase
MTMESSAVHHVRKGFIALPGAHYIALGLICLVPVLLYLPMLTAPFNGDEGFYATVARMMLHGGIPYRDAFDNKAPLVFVWYAISFLLFGETVWAPRLIVSLLLSMTTALVYMEGRLLFSHGGGLLAAAAFALSIGIVRFETDAQTEYFLLLPMVAGLLAFTVASRTDDLRLFVVSGLLNGLAIITRQTAVFPFAVILAYAIVTPSAGSVTSFRAWRPVFAMLAGAVLVGIVTVVPFVATGTVPDLWNALVVYSWHYSAYVPIYAKIAGLFTNVPWLTLIAGPWLLIAGLGVAHSMGERARPQNSLLVAWLAANILAIAVVGRFYHHQFVQLLPAFALLAPAGALFVREHWHRFAVRVSLCVSVSFAVSVCVALNGAVYVKGDPAARHIAVYQGQERTEWETRSEIVGDYIRNHSRESDTIYNIGFQPELYFYADRRPASRYAFDHLFITDDTLEQKALDDLQRHPPLLIIDTAANETQRQPYGAPLIREFLRTNYDFVAKVEYADIYELRGSIIR